MASHSSFDAREQPPRPDPLVALGEELCVLAKAGGADAVGLAPATPFLDVRAILEQRKAAGLHGGMHFTYGNPSRATDPAATLPWAEALVVAARSYRRADVPAPAASGAAGEVARYSWTDHYGPLRASLAPVAARLEAAGWQARILVDDNALVDRAAAHRAGLGWYGKNANLLLPGLGSWFVLGSVLTDAPLTAHMAEAPAPVPDGCGACTRCLPACPTGALVAPGVLDARRCLAWLLEAPGSFPVEHRAALGGRIYGCDECQVVCPPNRAADRRQPPPPAEDGAEPWVDLVELLAQDDATLLARFARWYIPRRQARYLRRNALVALGNVGDGQDDSVVAALRASLRSPDPLLAEHAAWAAEQLGRPDLVPA